MYKNIYKKSRCKNRIAGSYICVFSNDLLLLKSKSFVTSLIMFVMLYATALSSAEVYKWVDENGKVHFGDKPSTEKSEDWQEVEIKQGNISSFESSSNNSTSPTSSRLKEAKKRIYEAELRRREAEKKINELRELSRYQKSIKQQPLEATASKKAIASNESSKNISTQPCPIKNHADCSGRQDLKNADYSNMELHHVNFSYGNLEGAKFKDAKMFHVDFSGANLTGVDFTGTTCHHCKFDSANMTNVELSGEIISHTSFVGANFSNINYQAPCPNIMTLDIRRVKGFDLAAFEDWISEMRDKGQVRGIRYIHNGCDLGLKESDCSNKDLSGHHFLPTRLSGVNFSGANLRGANLLNTSATNSDFTGANLEGAELPVLNNHNIFKKANLRNANFNGKRIKGDFTEANLEGVVFGLVNIEGVNLKDAKLSGADFTNTQFNLTQLMEANIEGCKECAEVIKSSTIDVPAIKEYLSINSNDSDAVKADEKSRRQSMSQLAMLSRGQAVISEGDLVEILQQMLSPGKEKFYVSAFRIISKHQETAWKQGKSSSLCGNDELHGKLLPLLAYQNDEFDEITKSRSNRKITGSEGVREHAAECLLFSVNQSSRIQKAFVDAYLKEGDVKTKRKLIYGLVEENTDKTLPLLVQALKGNDIYTSDSAAQQLATWDQPPMELLPWLVDRYQGNRNFPKGYATLLSAYGASAQKYLPKLLAHKDEKKKNKWKDDGISEVIKNIQHRTKIQVIDRLPDDYSKQSVLNTYLIPNELLTNYDLKLVESPTHFLFAGSNNKDATYYTKIEQRVKSWYKEAMSYIKEPTKLNNPLYTEDRNLIETAVSRYALNSDQINKIKAASGTEYSINKVLKAGNENRFGVDVFVFENDLTAEKISSSFIVNLGARSMVLRRGRIVYVLWGDAITEHYFDSYYSKIKNKRF